MTQYQCVNEARDQALARENSHSHEPQPGSHSRKPISKGYFLRLIIKEDGYTGYSQNNMRLIKETVENIRRHEHIIIEFTLVFKLDNPVFE